MGGAGTSGGGISALGVPRNNKGPHFVEGASGKGLLGFLFGSSTCIN